LQYQKRHFQTDYYLTNPIWEKYMKTSKQTIKAPTHLNKVAAMVFISTVEQMKALDTYHETDDILIEQLAILVSQSRMLQQAVDSGASESLARDLNLLNSFAGQISRITNRLGIAQDSRPSDKPLGRPTKQSSLSVSDEDAAVWGNVLPIGGDE
jgi:hypothetical protein